MVSDDEDVTDYLIIGFDKPGFTDELYEVSISSGKGFKNDSSSWEINIDLSDITETPVSANVVLSVPNGVPVSGLEGTINIKIEYSYLDVSLVV